MPADDLSLRCAVTDLYTHHHGWLQGWLRQRLGNAFDAADPVSYTHLTLPTTPYV